MAISKDQLVQTRVFSSVHADIVGNAIDTEVSTGDTTVTGYFAPSIQSAVAATGTNLAGALALTGDVVHVSSVHAGANDGVKLRTPSTYRKEQVVINRGGANLKVYPPTATAKIGALSAGTELTLSNTQSLRFVAIANDEYEPVHY